MENKNQLYKTNYCAEEVELLNGKKNDNILNSSAHEFYTWTTHSFYENCTENSSQTLQSLKREVKISVEFMKIGEIDVINEKYTAEIDVECRWISDEKITNYDVNKHWNPCLYVENLLTETKQVIEYKVSVDSNYPERVIITEYRKIKGQFWERLELENFPVDVQELSVTICSKKSPNEINLESDENKLNYIDINASNTFTDQQKWRLFSIVKISHIASYDLRKSKCKLQSELRRVKHLKICATCYCARKPGYYIFNAIFLIFLITLCSLTLFAIDPKVPQSRFQSTITLILTSVSFKWVINRSLPTVSYLTSLDKYSSVSIFFLFLVCVWHSIVGSFWERDLSIFIDRIFLCFFGLIFVIIQLSYAAWMWFARAQVRILEQEEKLLLLNISKNFEQ